MKIKPVKRVKRGDRGFYAYGKPMKCSYGSLIEVYESSAAGEPHIWLAVDSGTAHLNVEQAEELINRLGTWLLQCSVLLS